jgi:hypothetical protein
MYINKQVPWQVYVYVVVILVLAVAATVFQEIWKKRHTEEELEARKAYVNMSDLIDGRFAYSRMG